MNRLLVAIDLETTGTDPNTDCIIEVSAVKFEGRRIVDTFQRLTNPYCAIPYRVRVLTGISQAEVDKAPPLSTVLEELTAFIGNHPIVGHNVSFDLAFLGQAGVHLANQCYDTFELAILLLRLDDYSLASLARHFKASAPSHRALPDALATAGVFTALLEKTCQLDPGLIAEINRLGANLEQWTLRPLFAEVASSATPAAGQFARAFKVSADRLEPLKTSACVQPLDIDNLATSLEPGGRLARTFPDFEYRPQQVKMMRSVAQALSRKEHLLVEAGTGTGKSIAYLLPAIRFALHNNTQVIISTNTINLQEQLMNKDIPGLLSCLAKEGDDLSYVALKGRSNYLCLRRWELLRQSLLLSAEEAHLLIRLAAWLASTQSGDRAELNLSSSEAILFGRLCAQEAGCLNVNCPHQQRACFLYRARRKAQAAHLVVVNHALLLSDLASGNKLLPDYRYLIIDEAHQLEAEATEQFGFHIGQRHIGDYLNRLTQSSGTSGLLPRIKGHFGVQRALGQQAELLHSRVEAARVHLSRFFDLLSRLICDHTQAQWNYERQLSITPGLRLQPPWSQIKQAQQELALALHDLELGLGRLHTELQDSPSPQRDDLASELVSLLEYGHQLGERLTSAISQPEPSMVYWCSLSGQEEVVSVGAAPLEVATILEQELFSRKDSVMLTSATLTAESGFTYIKERLGLGQAAGLIVESPFDYLSSTLVYLPQDIPEPEKAGYQAGVEQALAEMCRAAGGRTLALFTSHAALRATQAAIQPPLEKENILVLAQGVDGSPKQLLNAFKSSPRTVLLGTASLWEGIDVPGEALSLLVIARLPFSIPSDPLFSARSKQYDDPFNQYALPQAVLKFKQGFGRLIRSKRDRGVIVVLDRRLTSKYYGSAFLQSLPQCTIKRGPLRLLPREIIAWLGQT
jgi:predicted DnaQ family exonuclease/DinG family helicase